eukprot:m.520890 g.520890  ORF g.520890 m.520890 type:complete len:344 (-) comp21956_c0_seq2:3069-4100(-)
MFAAGRSPSSSKSGNMFGDSTGNLVIKARLGSDIRRIPIHNEELTYDDLVLMMLRVFHKKLSHSDDLLIKYTDEDGDLVTISDNGELSHAKQYGRVLRLTLFVNGVAPGGVLPAGRLRAELQQLSTAVSTLMTKLAQLSTEAAPEDNDGGIQEKSPAKKPPPSTPSTESVKVDGRNPSEQQNNSVPPSAEQAAQIAARGASFDPLGPDGTRNALAAASGQVQPSTEGSNSGGSDNYNAQPQSYGGSNMGYAGASSGVPTRQSSQGSTQSYYSGGPPPQQPPQPYDPQQGQYGTQPQHVPQQDMGGYGGHYGPSDPQQQQQQYQQPADYSQYGQPPMGGHGSSY